MECTASQAEALSSTILVAPSPEMQGANSLVYSPELRWSQRGLVAEDGVPSGAVAAAANRQAAWEAVAASERGKETRAMEHSSQL